MTITQCIILRFMKITDLTRDHQRHSIYSSYMERHPCSQSGAVLYCTCHRRMYVLVPTAGSRPPYSSESLRSLSSEQLTIRRDTDCRPPTEGRPPIVQQQGRNTDRTSAQVGSSYTHLIKIKKRGKTRHRRELQRIKVPPLPAVFRVSV